MKSNLNSKILVSLAVALLAGSFSIPAHAEVDCNKPGNWVDAKACAKAAEGIGSLRRYVQRTRMIHQLDINDYAKYVRQDDSAVAEEHTKTVASK
jgi:hypothetical protein